MAKKKKKGRRGLPEPVEHAAYAIMKKHGYTKDKAIAIATEMLQDVGYLKKGTHTLTAKGRTKLSKHYKEPKKERLKKVNAIRTHKKKTL